MQAYFNQQQNYKSGFRWRTKIYLIFAFIVLIFILIIYVVIYSPIFQVREFKIVGTEKFADEAVLNILKPMMMSDKLDIFLGWKNLLTWSQKKINISNTALLEANINRDWIRQSVVISAKERDRFAIWCFGNSSCYWLSEDGIIFEEAPSTEGSLILTVSADEVAYAAPGLKVVEDRFVKNLTSLLKGILELKLPIKNIIFDKRLQELRVKSYSGPDLYFSIRFDSALNLISLKSLKEKISFKGISYVDLRVENRLYYK